MVYGGDGTYLCGLIEQAKQPSAPPIDREDHPLVFGMVNGPDHPLQVTVAEGSSGGGSPSCEPNLDDLRCETGPVSHDLSVFGHKFHRGIALFGAQASERHLQQSMGLQGCLPSLLVPFGCLGGKSMAVVDQVGPLHARGDRLCRPPGRHKCIIHATSGERQGAPDREQLYRQVEEPGFPTNPVGAVQGILGSLLIPVAEVH